MSVNRDVRRMFENVAKMQHELRRRIEKVENAPADLRHAAVDGGQGPVWKDPATGDVVFQIGTDPVTGVTAPEYKGGPAPEQPSAPFVDAGGETVKVQHSGLDVNEAPAPANFRRAHVHVSQVETFAPSLSTLAGYLEEADGSFTHRLPGGEWYVGIVWETLSGKTSIMSGTVLADIPPLVDAQDIQDTLDEAQARLDEYRDEVAQPRFQALEEGLSENNDTLANARERLAEAEQTLSPLPGRVESAEQDVAAAQVEATKAAAAAVEANNRAMTRLANGNFESDLLYWEYERVTLDPRAHSGSQAARINDNGWLRPGSSFPVVPDQIWELSLYHQYDVTVELQTVDGDQRATLSTHHLDGDSTWSDSGALRVTIPADVHMLSFTITGTSAIVDDITLRDVTDVVRLEEAANANRQKAEQAISELAVMRLAVDGEGGLKDRLDSAENDLENIDTELDQVATNLTTALTGPITHDRLRSGTGAFDQGFIGELWAGNIRALAAELASLIVASPNMIPNGDLTQGDDFWTLSNAQLVTDDTPPGYEHAIRRAPNDGSVSHNVGFPVQGGEEYLWEMWIKADKPGSSFYWDMRDQDGNHIGHSDHGGSTENLEPEWYPHSSKWRPVSDLKVPTEWTRVRTVLRPSQNVTHLYMAATYFNHANGTERDATVSIGGVRMTPRAGAEVLVDGSITAEKITATREMITKIMGAEWAYIAQQLIVDGSILTRDLEALSAAIQSLTVTQRADIAQLWADQIWAALGVFNKLQAEEAWITSAMIQELTAEKVTVTEEFVGRVAELLHLVVDRIDANSLWADQTWQAAGHFGSQSADFRTRVDGQGVTTEQLADGEYLPASQLGGPEQALTFWDENQDPTATIERSGDAAFQLVEAARIEHQGRPLFAPDPFAWHDGPILDALPRGIVDRTPPVNVSGTVISGRTAYGFLEVAGRVEAGRVYRVSHTPFLMQAGAAYFGQYTSTFSATDTPPRAPHTDDPIFQYTRWWLATDFVGPNETGTVDFEAEESGIIRILLMVGRASSGTGIEFHHTSAYGRPVLTLEDLGPARRWNGMRRHAASGGSQNPDRDPVVLTQGFTTAWTPTWQQVYRGTVTATPHPHDSGSVIQGREMSSGQFHASMLGGYKTNPAIRGHHAGQTIDQALHERTLIAGRIIAVGTSQNQTGVTNFYWHAHGQPPTSLRVDTQPPNYIANRRDHAGTIRVSQLPDDALAAIQNGTFQGITIHPVPNTGGRDLRAYHGIGGVTHQTPVTIELTYEDQE